MAASVYSVHACLRIDKRAAFEILEVGYRQFFSVGFYRVAGLSLRFPHVHMTELLLSVG